MQNVPSNNIHLQKTQFTIWVKAAVKWYLQVGVDSAGNERSLGPLEAASSRPCRDTFSPRQLQRILTKS